MHIEILGKFFSNHSLAIVNRKLAIELSNLCSVSIIPLDDLEINTTITNTEFDKLVSLQDTSKVPDIQIRHSYPPLWKWPEHKQTKVVYIQPWEFSSIPSEWQYKFDTFADAVISPSTWNSEVYRNSGINPENIFTIPNGYDDTIFYNKNIRQNRKTIFLYVGCSQYRKGIDILLDVWAGITQNNPNVELIIKDTPTVYGKTNLESDILKLQYKTKCARITYIDDNLSEKEMSDLYNKAHVLVHPYRGEGFGMHIQEAMACGCLPIVTDGGPTNDFVGNNKIKSSAKIVNMYDIFALKQEDSMSNMGQHRWILEPDKKSLAELMVNAFSTGKTHNTSLEKLKTWKEVAEMYYHTLVLLNNRKHCNRDKFWNMTLE